MVSSGSSRSVIFLSPLERRYLAEQRASEAPSSLRPFPSAETMLETMLFFLSGLGASAPGCWLNTYENFSHYLNIVVADIKEVLKM